MKARGSTRARIRRRLIALKDLLRLADMITFANALFGLASIYFSLNQHLGKAAIMLLISVALDSMDGKVAGFMNQKHAFGRELDSLADIISFGMGPIIFVYAYQVSYMSQPDWIFLLACVFYLLCGVARLARYNVMQETKTFAGMPITVNGILFPLLFWLQAMAASQLLLFASGLLMISSIKVRRIL